MGRVPLDQRFANTTHLWLCLSIFRDVLLLCNQSEKDVQDPDKRQVPSPSNDDHEFSEGNVGSHLLSLAVNAD